MNCESPYIPCSPSPCQNGGSCIVLGQLSYDCNCVQGKTIVYIFSQGAIQSRNAKLLEKLMFCDIHCNFFLSQATMNVSFIWSIEVSIFVHDWTHYEHCDFVQWKWKFGWIKEVPGSLGDVGCIIVHWMTVWLLVAIQRDAATPNSDPLAPWDVW